MDPIADWQELMRLAQVAVDASNNGPTGSWTIAYAAHCKHYELVTERCRDAAYHQAYRAAVRGEQPSSVAERR